MSKKLFAFDMDGTLLIGGDQILPETLVALDEARAKGHITAIATGRSYQDIIRIGEEAVKRFDWFVCNNGTYLYDVKNDKFIANKFVPTEVLEDLIQIGLENETFFAAHTVDAVIRAQLADGIPAWAEKIVHEEWYRFNLMPLAELKAKLPFCQVTQGSLRGTKETIERIKPYFQKWADKADVHIAGEVYLDINPKDTSKMEGLIELGQLINLPVEDMVAFGDSGNDLQMLEGAGLGVCMENGTAEAKEAADVVIGHHKTPAIAKKIREIINH